jgi:hypothetical protein
MASFSSRKRYDAEDYQAQRGNAIPEVVSSRPTTETENTRSCQGGVWLGANFQTMTLPGTTSRDEVTMTFSKVQDRDRSQNDSQYAGGFGMCSGLILTDYNFHIRRTAEAYLVGRSQKWDHALAVKYDTSEGQNWLIGAARAIQTPMRLSGLVR